MPAEGIAAPSKSGPPDVEPMVVGIGGSAGSLEPLRELLSALPADNGIAFVVVSHQAPTGRSMLPAILSKCTAMPVIEIDEAILVEPNHVYVEPRGRDLAIRGGTLSLEPVAARGVPHLPIDLFFRALAHDRGSLAAGIVLSGTGTDGTLGLAAIRAASGLSLVQDPATAEFDGMPGSAVRARVADFVLSPAAMPGRLLLHRNALPMQVRGESDSEISRDDIHAILAVMRQHGGHDFSEYKHGTLGRRVARRMALQGIASPREYARYLEQHEGEIDALWHDWLIGVSSFFRDPEVFQALESVLPELLEGREDGAPLRIWVPACATGEEAYSLLIVLTETLRRLQKRLDLQMFATDLNPAAIQIARAARYPEAIAPAVGEARLTRFFTPGDGQYQLRRELRDLVVFAVHDALHDPPFTRVDLISCRNLLIYLEPREQRRLLRSFHYSLNPRGLLLLGSSENATGSEEHFSPSLEAKARIFRRNDSTPSQPTILWPTVIGGVRNGPVIRDFEAKTDLSNPLSRALAERFAPPAVLVDLAGRIQQVHGNVSPYLRLQAGRINVNIVDMAREGLRTPISSVLREAIDADGGVAERSIGLHLDDGRITVHLEAWRLDEPRLAAPVFLVSFDAVARGAQTRASEELRIATDGKTQPGANLEQELRETRHDLQGSIDELQAANEELAAANEEAQSANEELQSTVEELHTAKEETQSLNEELHTVNAELTRKLETFERATDDLVNLMNNIEVATIFLDGQLRVKRFTPQARNVAHLLDADIGRPLADLATHLDYPELLSDAERVIDTLHTAETQAPAPDGHWYLVRIRPYRTARNVVEGVVITFLDITDAKRNERLDAARALTESIVDAVSEPFLVLDDGLRVVRANRSYYRMFDAVPDTTEGRLIGDLENRQWSAPALRKRLGKALQDGTGFEELETEMDLPRLGRRRLRLHARPLTLEQGRGPQLILLGIQQINGPPAEAADPGGGRP